MEESGDGVGESGWARRTFGVAWTVAEGFHEPLGGMLRMSRQIRPAESMFGW